MFSRIRYGCIAGLLSLIFLISCSSNSNNKRSEKNPVSTKILLSDSLNEISITDSVNHLTHIKGLFYKGRGGHLYIKTWYNKEVAGIDTLVDSKYFNGEIPQYIDPYTFTQFDLYATDKTFVYFCQPTSEGLVIFKIDNADPATFKAWEDPYSIASDAKHVYLQGQLLKGIDPSKTQRIINKEGEITGLRFNNINYTDSMLDKLTY